VQLRCSWPLHYLGRPFGVGNTTQNAEIYGSYIDDGSKSSSDLGGSGVTVNPWRAASAPA